MTVTRYTHKTAKPDPTTVFLVTIDRGKPNGYGNYGNGYLTIRAEARRLVDDSIESVDNGYPWTLPYLSGLVVRCQGTNDDPAAGVYGWTREYEVGWRGIDGETAEAMYLTMKRVDTAMQRMASVDGTVTSFGIYVLRVARALGLSLAVRNNERRRDITGCAFRRMNPVEAAAHIDFEVREWQRDMAERLAGKESVA